MSRSKGLRGGRASDEIVSTVTVDMTACERDWFDQMRVKIACTSDANLLRIALWRYARFLELDCGIDVFACRAGTNAAAKPNDNALEAARLRRLQRKITA